LNVKVACATPHRSNDLELKSAQESARRDPSVATPGGQRVLIEFAAVAPEVTSS